MTDLVYRSVMRDIKQKILNNEYEKIFVAQIKMC